MQKARQAWPRLELTDKFINSKRCVPGCYRDSLMTKLILRVLSSGRRSFMMIEKWPGTSSYGDRVLGVYGEISLADARDKARHWRQLLQKGIDPEVQEAREFAEVQRQQANTWAAVVADFLDQHCSNLTHAKEARAILQRDLGARWGHRPITDITEEEVARVVLVDVKRGVRYQAGTVFGWIKLLYNWAIGVGAYGVKHSPCANLKKAKLIGRLEPRQRILSDDELRALWAATDPGLSHYYPFGAFVRMLMLTGARKSEVARMTWKEVDVGRKLWTIPVERTKTRRSHEIPLSGDAVALLEALPRFHGPHVFSRTYGEKPINGFSKDFDHLKRSIAQQWIEEAATADRPARWTIHDIRRTVRTGLSKLRVPDVVSELVIGHVQKGLHAVYDQHAYADEKREALNVWAAHLRSIVEPNPPNVTELAHVRAERRAR
ncbi:MAG TPA: tyrosine-type recombinase/integrase [Stellaceae bacterium]|nr:tyrosine-type recombinase/integrase [Stellaceae bacterium]